MGDMECKGKFIVKSVVDKEAGEMKRTDGTTFKYDAGVQVKFDEVNPVNGEITERKTKVLMTESALVAKLKEIKPYTKCELTFKAGFTSTGASLKLIDVATVKPN